jgi:isocitrate/isopropylmalate dehydrogenase
MHAINFGEGIRVFETFHGAAREEIGSDRANPLPLLLPAVDLLEAIGQKGAAARILAAIGRVLSERCLLTPDLGGTAGTRAMAEAIVTALA